MVCDNHVFHVHAYYVEPRQTDTQRSNALRLCNTYMMHHMLPTPTRFQEKANQYLFGHLQELWTFSVTESAFVKYLGLLNLSKTFKHVMSHMFYNFIDL